MSASRPRDQALGGGARPLPRRTRLAQAPLQTLPKPLGPRLRRRRVHPPFPFVDPLPVVALDIGSRSSAGAARPFGGRQRVQGAGAPAGGVERGGALLGLRLGRRRVAVRFEVAHPPGDGIGVALARLPAPDPVVDHDAAVLAFPLLGDLRQPQAGAAERGRLPPIGVHLADDQVPVRVVGVVVRDHNREVVFEAERAQGALGEPFDRLRREHPGMFLPGQLRTLQRRVKDWRRLAARRLVFADPIGASQGAAASPSPDADSNDTGFRLSAIDPDPGGRDRVAAGQPACQRATRVLRLSVYDRRGMGLEMGPAQRRPVRNSAATASSNCRRSQP